MTELINYPKLVDEAMREIVSKALQAIFKNESTNGHHFYISFSTQMLGVQMPDYLREKYQEEITIVLQHQFEDLVIEKNKFSVSLKFDGKLERLVVPFKALTAFSDPSVGFTIEFTSHDPIHISEDKEQEENHIESNDSSNVIALDMFRDKNKKLPK